MRERESPVVICNCITEIAVRPELQFVWNVLVLNRRYAGFTAVSSHVVENTVRGFARQTFETESGRCAVDTGLGALHVVHPDTVGGTPCEENSASVVRCELVRVAEPENPVSVTGPPVSRGISAARSAGSVVQAASMSANETNSVFS